MKSQLKNEAVCCMHALANCAIITSDNGLLPDCHDAPEPMTDILSVEP